MTFPVTVVPPRAQTIPMVAMTLPVTVVLPVAQTIPVAMML